MAYLIVTTQADVVDSGDGQLSLREAIAQANATAGADYIKFVVTLEGQTLVLTGGELAVTQDLTIDGDRDHDGNMVTIDGNANGRILNISGGGTDVFLQNIALTNGQAEYPSIGGGAILLATGSLTLNGVTVANSEAYGDYRGGGGGIFAADSTHLSVANSRIINNSVDYYGNGGGVATGSNVTMIVRGSEFSGNSVGYRGDGGGISIKENSSVMIESSKINNNHADDYGAGGGLALQSSQATIGRSVISGNTSNHGGGILSSSENIFISDSTVANNIVSYAYEMYPAGGGISGGVINVSNTIITGNSANSGGGISGTISLNNSIIAGNKSNSLPYGPDIFGIITLSNGHNVFGTDVIGNAPGDRENATAVSVFATIDPITGGGKLSTSGVVPLKNSTTNPALSGSDPIAASSFGQLGTTARPLPAGSLPDIGSTEIKQPLSTSPTVNNDVLTGSNAANNLSGLAGNDLVLGLAGADTLNGNDGSDVLDGGPGNDKLNGGIGMDIATFAGTAAVVVDLAATPATAKRGSETDTLTSIEGIIGSSKADTLKGDAQNNEFQGGLGKDTATGGGGRDLHAFRSAQDSPAGTNRDIIKDFAPGQDVLDVSNLDADSTLPGQQSFRWVGKATLTGAAQLGYYVSGGNTIVRASTDADVPSEVEIQLTGVKTLTAGDFRF